MLEVRQVVGRGPWQGLAQVQERLQKAGGVRGLQGVFAFKVHCLCTWDLYTLLWIYYTWILKVDPKKWVADLLEKAYPFLHSHPKFY